MDYSYLLEKNQIVGFINEVELKQEDSRGGLFFNNLMGFSFTYNKDRNKIVINHYKGGLFTQIPTDLFNYKASLFSHQIINQGLKKTIKLIEIRKKLKNQFIEIKELGNYINDFVAFSEEFPWSEEYKKIFEILNKIKNNQVSVEEIMEIYDFYDFYKNYEKNFYNNFSYLEVQNVNLDLLLYTDYDFRYGHIMYRPNKNLYTWCVMNGFFQAAIKYEQKILGQNKEVLVNPLLEECLNTQISYNQRQLNKFINYKETKLIEEELDQTMENNLGKTNLSIKKI
mgnify:CR=1 FL=1